MPFIASRIQTPGMKARGAEAGGPELARPFGVF
jgi:hypothetical protein